MENYSSTTDNIRIDDVWRQLKHIIDPLSKQNVVDAGMISGITIRGDQVGFMITIHPDHKAEQLMLQEQCEQAVLRLAGVAAVRVLVTAHHDQPDAAVESKAAPAARARAVWQNYSLPHVKKIIAVASGKGGVGKSSISALLAISLAAAGKKVGLLDADIYGPSAPTLFQLSEKPDVEDGLMLPLRAHGIAVMSMGLIMGDQAAILRAPMVTKALAQMLKMTRWGTEDAPLDLLIIDTPPGTGDILLSLVQQVKLDGVLVVTMPSELSLMDARKSCDMFAKTGVPLLGIVENMSRMENGLAPFGSGGGKKLAEETQSLLLGELALDAEVGACLNAGLNPYQKCPGSGLLQSVDQIAQTL